jgi:hypothetical protein
MLYVFTVSLFELETLMTELAQKVEYIRDIVREIAVMAETETRLELLAYLLRMAQAEAANMLSLESNKLCR